MKKFWVLASVLLAAPSAAYAAPGLDDVVYGATVEPGKTEIETRYGRLAGREADGEDAFVLEVAHGFSSRFYGAALATFEREPGSNRRLQTLALEGIFTLGHVKSLDLDAAIYVEAEHGIHGPDNIETKLLLEHRKGAFDSRLNLIAERELTSAAPVEFGYAASADYAVADDISLGAEAFGDLGTSHNITTRSQHFAGPAMKIEFDHAGSGELELRAGYLFALDRARDNAKGQLRVGMEFEF
jgi:hypothetical protein